MTDLDKAREWADRWSEDDPLILADAKAAIKLIKGLPDQWVDVEKVREVISGQLSFYTRGTASHYIAEKITRNLEALIAPKLPTLADMTPEEREACRWMQAQVFPTASTLGIITCIDEYERSAIILFTDGMAKNVPWEDIAPLTGEPKLQWPGSVPVMDHEIHCDGCRCGWEGENGPFPDPDNERALPRPEDVPANEPWLIEVEDEKAVGTRYTGNTVVPWSVASLDGSFAGDYNDNEITLIHKLVPEPPALPEGMRLADHEEYGRVVVSPKVDTDGDYRVFCPQDNTEYGANWWYAHKSALTFLGGDQRA